MLTYYACAKRPCSPRVCYSAELACLGFSCSVRWSSALAAHVFSDYMWRVHAIFVVVCGFPSNNACDAGVAETDLHNIACGPPLQDLPLLDGLHTVGRIFFELQMIEHRAVEIAHHNLFFSFDDAYAIRGPTIFKMWCRKDDMRDGVAMPFVASIPDPRRVRL